MTDKNSTNADDLPPNADIAVPAGTRPIELEQTAEEVPTQIQVELIDTQLNVSDNAPKTEHRILEATGEAGRLEYLYGDFRDALREYIREMEPYLRDGNISDSQLVWEEVDLATKRPAGELSEDDVITDTLELGEWVGLRSIVEAEPDAEIPLKILENGRELAMMFMGAKLVDSEGIEAAYGTDL